MVTIRNILVAAGNKLVTNGNSKSCVFMYW